MSIKRKILFGLCLLVATLAVAYITFYYTGLRQQADMYAALQAQQASSQAIASSAPAAATAQPTPTPTPVVIPIDFATLQQQYPDIYAWIEIPDTDVNYPILQHPTDDTYYLNYNLDGTRGYPGCIYTEHAYNHTDFSDFNTILYGHNMKNGSMFGGLKQYRDSAYLEQHRDIIIYTPTEKRTYRVFAALVYDDRYLPAAFADTDSGRTAFLQSLQDVRNMNSQYLTDVTVDADSQILTLSTCIGGQPNNRYFVEAVYVPDE